MNALLTLVVLVVIALLSASAGETYEGKTLRVWVQEAKTLKVKLGTAEACLKELEAKKAPPPCP